MLNRKAYRFATLAMAVGLMAPLARADEKGTAAPATSDPNPSANAPAPGTVADRDFVIKAANGGMLEVKLGEIAHQKATAADVKQFGQHMVEDHTKANDELMAIAKQKGITCPTELKGDEKETYDRLSKLSGSDFDKQYVAAMVKDHKGDIADFEKESQGGKDADVKAYATKTLPTLESHYKMIQQVARSNGVATEDARTAGDKQPAEVRPSASEKVPQK
jgi:putative membrane protein